MNAFGLRLSFECDRSIIRVCAYAVAWLVAFGVSNPANAYGTVSGGIITGIYINETLGNVAYITISGGKSSGPSCSTSPDYQYVLNLSNGDASQQFAMLLSARLTQTPVTLTGAGACDLVATVETLWVVTL